METAEYLAVVIILVCAVASFFFSLAETALFSLTKWQVRALAERPGSVGRVAKLVLAESQDLLATMVLGNTFASAGMLSVSLWMALSTRWNLSLAVAGVLLLTLLGVEVFPKTLAVRRPEFWAERVASLLALAHRVARPFHQFAQRLNRAMLQAVIPASVKPQPAFTDAEYQELVELAFQQGSLAQSAKDIILQILNLNQRTASEVMRPRARMAAIPDDLPLEEMIAAARSHRHRRLPMFDETPDTIVGILNARALLLDPSADLADLIEFPSFVPETMNLLQLLQSLQRQKRGMAIVLDEFGGVAGLVTMEDILAAVVGRFRGESAAAGFVMEKLGAGRWRVNGTMRVEDFRREFPALGEVAEVETMGGLLTNLLDVVPAVGEAATFRGLKLTARAADERRVRELLVEKVN
ncbi:MAG: HlyC/CorC family transporter [Verrucomicrobia bacterium]|nr:MAG: HlyC/CorC family transporter [Verrucomicrobiota bacterium]